MDTSKEIVLTPEGRAELVAELAVREGEKNDEILASLKEARAFGDLSENAEFDAAKDEQARNEARIREIRQILAVARVMEATDDAVMSVSIGSTVTLEAADGRQTVLSIVGTTETNSLRNRISNESPAGQALIGHIAGDTVSYTTPRGKVRTFKILDITRS